MLVLTLTNLSTSEILVSNHFGQLKSVYEVAFCCVDSLIFPLDNLDFVLLTSYTF